MEAFNSSTTEEIAEESPQQEFKADMT